MEFWTRRRRGGPRRALAILAVVALAAAGCGSSGDGGGEAAGGGGEVRTLKIGDVETLTGAGASVGKPQAEAVRLAVDQINTAGGIDVGGTKYQLELVTRDDASNPAEGVKAVQELLNAEQVNFMIGFVSSAVMGAVLPVIKDRDDVVAVVVSAALDGITDNPSVYRPRVTLPQYTTALLGHLEQTGGIDSMALLTDNKHAGFVAETAPLKEGLAKQGIRVVNEGSYSFGDTQFGPQVTAMLRSAPDALNMRGYPADVARAVKAARDQGFTGPILTNSGLTATEVGQAQAAGAMGGVTEVFAPLPSDLIEGGENAESARRFLDAFKAKAGTEPGGTSLSGYGGVYVLARALEKAGTVEDVAAVRRALDELTVQDVPELVEPVVPQEGGRIFAERQAYFKIAVRQWRDGAFHPVAFQGTSTS